jgi:hypothetical protein
MLTECPNRFPADLQEFCECAEEWMEFKVYPDGQRGRLNQPAALLEALTLYRRFARA